MILLIGVIFIVVHGLDGQEVNLNVNEISSISESKGQYLGSDVKCTVFMTNGKFLGVTESCAVVIQKVKEAE